MTTIHAHERSLSIGTLERLAGVPGLTLHGLADPVIGAAKASAAIAACWKLGEATDVQGVVRAARP